MKTSRFWLKTNPSIANVLRIVAIVFITSSALISSQLRANAANQKKPLLAGPSYELSITIDGTGIGSITSEPAGINCGATCSATFDYGTVVTLTATPASNFDRLLRWSGDTCYGDGPCTITINGKKSVTATFEKSTFGDVPFNHPRWEYIQSLWDRGFTSGCAPGSPPLYCPENTMTRAESAVFMLRGQFGSSYVPPAAPWGTFADNWALGTWAEKWAEGMWDATMTAGCQTNPLKFCPWDLFNREQAAVFGLRMKYGMSYTPPAASGSVFADMTSTSYWATKWAEKAYADGLLVDCGIQDGKPLFCPLSELDRSWSANLIVQAKGFPFGDQTAPQLTISGMTADGTTMGGNLASGYTLKISNDPGKNHLLQFATGTTASETLNSTYFGLKLISSTVSAANLKAFYVARGVAEPYLSYLKDAVDKINPFVYINGSTLRLVDATQHDIAGSADVGMTMQDYFPLGTYIMEGKIADRAGNETTVTLKLVLDESYANDDIPNCRFGMTAPYGITGYPIETMGIGGYLNWGMQANPSNIANMDYIQVVRLRDANDHYVFDPAYPSLGPALLANVASIASSAPGSFWLIGNEPDTRFENQDELTPEQYAVAYHDVYEAIMAADSTAKIGIGTIVQPTPIRMKYLDLMWDKYIELYGVTPPSSFWSIHSFILPELSSWGTGIPPGMDSYSSLGVNYTVEQTDSITIFMERLLAFRVWMAAKGEQDKPLWITEYGSLLPSDPRLGLETFPMTRTRDYMIATFNYLTSAVDPTYGNPLDGNRLVQEWYWYSLNDYPYKMGGGLFDPENNKARTIIGDAFVNYVSLITATTNLGIHNLSLSPEFPASETGVNYTLSGRVANSGNSSVPIGTRVVVSESTDGTNYYEVASYTYAKELKGCGESEGFTLTWTEASLATTIKVSLELPGYVVDLDPSDNQIILNTNPSP